MRHLNKGRSLSRSTSHRKALLANLAQDLFQHKRIRTTLAKAKELRPYAEKLVTNAKKGHLAARRHVLRYLSRTAVVKVLFEEIAPKFADRNGGYIRIIKLTPRIGDNAPLAIVELVGYEGVMTVKEEAKEKKGEKKAAEKKAATKKSKAAAKKPAGEAREVKSAKEKKAPKEKAAHPAAKSSPKKTAGQKGGTKGRSKSGDRG